MDHTSPKFFEVQIKASKLYPFCKGAVLYLDKAAWELCPVAANLDYVVRQGAEVDSFYMFTDIRYLTRDRFVSVVMHAELPWQQWDTTVRHTCTWVTASEFGNSRWQHNREFRTPS